MRRLSWTVWLLLPLILVTPVLRFADIGGPPAEFGAKTHVYRAPFAKTPWISDLGIVLFFLRLIGPTVLRDPGDRMVAIADPPFVPPEA